MDERRGREVVLKVAAATESSMDHERLTLQSLAQNGFPAPTVVSHGAITLSDGTARQYLLLDYLPGVAPKTTLAYRRLGRRLAELHATRITPGHLRWLTAAVLADRHVAAVHLLEHVLSLGVVRSLLSLKIPADELTIAHGDPGPENFLDDASGGVLIDFGSASMASTGLDLARTCVVAALHVDGPERESVRNAVVSGYTDEAGALPDDLDRWSAIATVHIAEWRYQHRARTDTPPLTQATELLERRLWC